jgi:hypothetical protein
VKLFLCILSSLCIYTTAYSQELNCRVQVILSANTTSINQRVFRAMEKNISDFINLRKWTDETYANHQKISSYLTINITDASKENAFVADFTLQSERPVFGTTYNTPLIRHKDVNIPFDYIENQPLDYADNNFFSNLTATLAFHAYYMLATDYESFSPKGGQAYFEKAQAICNLVPPNLNIAGTPVKGWQASEALDISGQQTRVGMVLAMMSTSNEKFRLAMHKYHILGIDVLESDEKKALEQIEQSLQDILDIQARHYIHKHFVLTKADEIIQLFKKESSERRKKIGNILIGIEPLVTEKVGKGF